MFHDKKWGGKEILKNNRRTANSRANSSMLRSVHNGGKEEERIRKRDCQRARLAIRLSGESIG